MRTLPNHGTSLTVIHASVGPGELVTELNVIAPWVPAGENPIPLANSSSNL